MIYSRDKTLKDLLETGYAYFYNNQIPVTDDGLNQNRFVYPKELSSCTAFKIASVNSSGTGVMGFPRLKS